MEEGTDTAALTSGEADYMRSIARATVEAAIAAAPQPSPTPQADSQPAPVRDYPQLPEPQYQMGGKGHSDAAMRAYVDADRTARAPADSQPAPVRPIASVGAKAAAHVALQFGGCPECGSRSCVARECSRTVSHAAQAIPGVQWQCGPQASGFTAPQADSQPAPEYVGNGMFKGETIQKAAEHWANWCDVRCMTGLSEFLRVVAARDPADSVTAPATESYVQTVPDKCDRIVWRGHYYHLPLTTPAQAADSVLEDAARLLESQHTWLTNVAAANLVRSLAARKQGANNE